MTGGNQAQGMYRFEYGACSRACVQVVLARHVQKRMIKTLPSSETLTTVSPSAPDWKKSNVHLLHFIQGACKVTHTLRLPKMMISNNHWHQKYVIKPPQRAQVLQEDAEADGLYYTDFLLATRQFPPSLSRCA